uniref:Uncharacterized protein n=1 Tax=Glossina pallidipes TaxID=7398 RepID=A0A1A9Z8N3_GLOPL
MQEQNMLLNPLKEIKHSTGGVVDELISLYFENKAPTLLTSALAMLLLFTLILLLSFGTKLVGYQSETLTSPIKARAKRESFWLTKETKEKLIHHQFHSLRAPKLTQAAAESMKVVRRCKCLTGALTYMEIINDTKTTDPNPQGDAMLEPAEEIEEVDVTHNFCGITEA